MIKENLIIILVVIGFSLLVYSIWEEQQKQEAYCNEHNIPEDYCFTPAMDCYVISRDSFNCSDMKFFSRPTIFTDNKCYCYKNETSIRIF